jgi:hypothetical protein
MKFLTGLLVILLPTWAWAYEYPYMRDHRARANKIAERIFVSETKEAPYPFEELKEIVRQAKSPQDCLLKMRRQAVRDKGDGILNLKYEGILESDVLTCKGQLVKWKISETMNSDQGSESQPTEKK